MGGYDDSSVRPTAGAPPAISARSHLAGPAAIVLLFVGLIFGTYSILVPGLIGLLMVMAALSFVSMRLNPFATSFYLPTKPSWTAIAVTGVVGLLLLSAAWSYWKGGVGPLLPRSFP